MNADLQSKSVADSGADPAKGDSLPPRLDPSAPLRIEHFTLNGRPATASAGCSIAVAVLANDVSSFRRSVAGEPRAPLCAMGICYECRLTIDGQPHQKSCQIVLRSGMVVQTDG